MFYIIRYVVCAAILLLTLIAAKKRPVKPAKRLAVFGIVVCLFYSSILFPIEQVHGFQTPQEVFHYMCVGNIDFVEYGQDTAYIAYHSPVNQGEIKSAVIEKREGKYIVKVVRKIDTVYSFLDDGCSVKIYNVKNTNDYYITIFGMFDTESVSDSENHIFQFLRTGDIGFTTVYIQNINSYQLHIPTPHKQQTIEVGCADDGSLKFFSTAESEQETVELQGAGGGAEGGEAIYGF